MSESIKATLLRNFRAALRQRDAASADAVLMRLRELDPLGGPTRCCEVELALLQGRVAEAKALADALVELHPASPKAQFLAGQVAAKRRDWRLAAEHFRESDLLHGNDRCKRMLGRALANAGSFDEAEAILEQLQRTVGGCDLDLAWVDERRGDLGRALARVEAFLRRHPDDAHADKARARLQAAMLDPAEVQEEVEDLEELGESVGVDTLARYVEIALARGDAGRVRDLVAARLPALCTRDALRLAYPAYHAGAFDLAADLLLRALPDRATDYKFLATLEKAARNGGRLPDLRAAYASLAPRFKALYGRLRRLDSAAG